MRMSSLFLRTLRDDPADAEVDSHRLLVRAGYIRRIAAGIGTGFGGGIAHRREPFRRRVPLLHPATAAPVNRRPRSHERAKSRLPESASPYGQARRR